MTLVLQRPGRSRFVISDFIPTAPSLDQRSVAEGQSKKKAKESRANRGTARVVSLPAASVERLGMIGWTSSWLGLSKSGLSSTVSSATRHHLQFSVES